METSRPALKPIYLTFDDGPLEPFTSQILDVLDKYNAKATFFVCGKNAEVFPEIVKKIAAAGHSLGNHSYSHPWVRSYLGLLEKEVKKTDQILYELAGSRPYLLRMPWGIHWPWVKKFAKDNGYNLLRWDVAGLDWFKVSPEYISGRILRRLRPKSIVLLHDGSMPKGRDSRSNTVKALEQILQALPAQGYYAEKIT